MRCLAAVLLVGTVACGEAPAPAPAQSDTGCERIEVERDTFRIGDVLVSEGAGLAAITMTNSSDEPLRVHLESSDSTFSINPASFEIAPGGSGGYVLTIKPTVPGPAEATLVEERGCTRKETLITLTAHEPWFSCDPEAIEFGDVPIGIEVRQTVTCTNLSDSEVTLDLAEQQCEDCPDQFVLEPASLPEDGLRIPVGGTASFDVAFTPVEEGSIWESVSLSTGIQLDYIQFSGKGVPAD